MLGGSCPEATRGPLRSCGSARAGRCASRCRLVKIDLLDLPVEELDAVDGTPVLDTKPWLVEFGPQDPIHQATWTTEMPGGYFERSA